MLHSILLAYDGSAAADHAFARAIELARRGAARLHVVTIARSAEAETHVLLDRVHTECWARLQTLSDRAGRLGVRPGLEVVDGLPAEQIVAAAKRVHADLIVMGHRHRGLLDRCAQASVAKRVLDHAPCDVMVAL